ncbi:MAG TPA: hypothetical protein VMV33_02595 [Rhodocyclaceae bacterium]|nr:hypothetical protein [Rhodocyclaceae bacterium]
MNWNPDDHYKSRAEAADCDASPLSSIPGWVFDFLEKRLVAKYFSRLPQGSSIADAPRGTGRRISSSPRTRFVTARSMSDWTYTGETSVQQFMTSHLS